jgi:hypothetical protein
MASKVVDLILIYQFLKRLTTPFNKTDAYELGLIDEKGKRTDKKIETKEEEEAYGYFDRLVFNIKRLIEKVSWRVFSSWFICCSIVPHQRIYGTKEELHRARTY